MTELNFAAEHHDDVLSGRQTASIRRYVKGDHEFLKNDRLKAIFAAGDGRRKRAVGLTATAHTEIKPLNRLTNAEAQAAGFADRWAAWRELKRRHPGIKPKDRIAVIRFRAEDQPKTPGRKKR